uniref:Radical SAM protein n=1 Tax=Burkholderia phage vB_BgluM-SURPRISE13 TaxID=3159457 RepID=A0AAU7PF44_9VIRU
MSLAFKSDSNSSMTIDKASQYHLSLSLEWLKGCQFNCKGCHVNKQMGLPFTGDDLANLNKWVSSMRDKGNYLPTIVFLQPTDFLTAENTLSILKSPFAYSVLSVFKRLSLQTTFLNMEHAAEIASVLKARFFHMELELNFIIEPEKVNNEKYLETIRANRAKFIEMLDWKKHIASFAIMNVYEYDQVKKNDVKKILADYQALHEKIKDKFNSTIDFNFSMTRNPWWSNEDVADAVRGVSRIFDGGVDNVFNQTIRFSFGKLEDSSIEKHYNWHQGHLYVSPMIYERIASFHPKLRIPHVLYSVLETEDYERRLLIDQYDNSETKTECNSCRYQASCIDRNVLTFMDMHEIKDCIIARKALDAINVI